MPITKSAKKALRQNKRRKNNNLKTSKKFKEAINQYKKAIEANDKDKANKILPLVYKNLDKAAKKNVIDKNKASRLKSRLSKKIKSFPAA
jgi:small subunit ribosomal protein S20